MARDGWRLALLLGAAIASGCTVLYGSPRDGSGGGRDLGSDRAPDLGGGSDGPRLAWSQMVSNSFEVLDGVWGCDGGHISVVGSNGAILTSQSFGSWHTMVYGANSFNAISGNDCTQLYTAGDSNTFYMASAIGSWISSKLPNASGNLFGVASNGSNVIAVGAGGEIRRGSLGAAMWMTPTSGVTTTLYAVWASGPSLYAAGAGGVIVHSADSGGTWSPLVSGTTHDLHGGWASASEGDVYAVGDGGVILHSADKGASWQAGNSGTSATLYAVWGAGPLDVYVVGAKGTVLHSTDGGQRWDVEATPATSDLHAVWGAAASDVYAVGDVGTILHRP